MPKAQGQSRQQALGALGGTVSGNIGDNKFLVERARDGRSVCQLRTCKRQILEGELRLGKRPMPTTRPQPEGHVAPP